MSKTAFKTLRKKLRAKVSRKSFPGHEESYPVFYPCADGEILCAPCVNKEIALAHAARNSPDPNDWGAIAHGEDISSCHTKKENSCEN